MNRRQFLGHISVGASAVSATTAALLGDPLLAGDPPSVGDEPNTRDWLARWEKSILSDAALSRYCDKEMGEELGWLISPFLDGFYYRYLAKGGSKWLEMFVDWADSLIRRAVKGPDRFIGWPKGDGGGGESKEYSADSLLGEAMVSRAIVMMAHEIEKRSIAIEAKWQVKAREYLELAERIFEKWDSRDAWRETKDGGLWVVPAFGIDPVSGKWSAGHADRKTTGFSNPNNKQNHIARWLLAMFDATGKPVYRERAEKWFRLMKARMKTRAEGKYFVWNYWEPAGPWDYKPDGSPKHWIGVHPNGGYYEIDVAGMVAAFEHKLVFSQTDIDGLIATNRDFMWNHEVKSAKFQRIDGGEPDSRWKNSPGVLWEALVPYDQTLEKIFIANHDPAGWGGLATTPWYLYLNRG